MSLRWRLTLYYAAVSASILLLGGLAFYLALRQNLYLSLDNSLREAAMVASSSLEIEQNLPKHFDAEVAAAIEGFPGKMTLRLLDARGQDLDRIGTLALQAPPVQGFSSLNNTRIHSVQLPDGDWVQVLRSQAESMEALSRALNLLLYGLPLLLLVGAGAGYFLADRALRPVDAVVGLAQNIAAQGRYQQRVPETPGNDEMARLTQTVNAMLSRLEDTIEREKAFALAAAHELRTPLTLLRGRASLSLEKERSPEQYRQALSQIDQDSRDLVRVVESLLLLARSNQPPTKQAVQLDFLALEAAEGLQGLARERQVKVHLELESACAQGDPTTLRTAIANLIHNALQYGREKGQIWVRSQSQTAALDATYTVVEVADDGPGIAKGELERLRQPFQRGQGLQAVAGSGLGLALVGAIARQHGGQLVLGRAKQGGLLARIELPAEGEPTRPSRPVDSDPLWQRSLPQPTAILPIPANLSLRQPIARLETLGAEWDHLEFIYQGQPAILTRLPKPQATELGVLEVAQGFYLSAYLSGCLDKGCTLRVHPGNPQKLVCRCYGRVFWAKDGSLPVGTAGHKQRIGLEVEKGMVYATHLIGLREPQGHRVASR